LLECCPKPSGGFGVVILKKRTPLRGTLWSLEEECLPGVEASKWSGQRDGDDVSERENVTNLDSAHAAQFSMTCPS
jgi:hypothetical protein